MKLNFKYSLDTENARVKNTVRKKDFFIQNGYKIIMPEGYSLDSEDFSKIEKQIEKEFDKEKVTKLKSDISNNWDKYETDIDAFLKRLPYKIPDELITIFTYYGVGGSYDLPNKIVINVNYGLNTFSTIVHELIHLIIEEPVIKKFDIEHWDKESLVDYLFVTDSSLNKIFPNYKYQQKSPDKKLLERVGWV